MVWLELKGMVCFIWNTHVTADGSSASVKLIWWVSANIHGGQRKNQLECGNLYTRNKQKALRCHQTKFSSNENWSYHAIFATLVVTGVVALTTLCPKSGDKFNPQPINIDSDNGLAPIRWQVIILINDGSIYRRIYASLVRLINCFINYSDIISASWCLKTQTTDNSTVCSTDCWG